MIWGRRIAVRLLASTGWYAIWFWIVHLSIWGWEPPWDVFRAPLAAVIAGFTGWPLQLWIDHKAAAPEPSQSEES